MQSSFALYTPHIYSLKGILCNFQINFAHETVSILRNFLLLLCQCLEVPGFKTFQMSHLGLGILVLWQKAKEGPSGEHWAFGGAVRFFSPGHHCSFCDITTLEGAFSACWWKYLWSTSRSQDLELSRPGSWPERQLSRWQQSWADESTSKGFYSSGSDRSSSQEPVKPFWALLSEKGALEHPWAVTWGLPTPQFFLLQSHIQKKGRESDVSLTRNSVASAILFPHLILDAWILGAA